MKKQFDLPKNMKIATPIQNRFYPLNHESIREKTILRLMIESGLRPGEIIHLDITNYADGSTSSISG